MSPNSPVVDSLPLYSESSEFLRMVSEEFAREMISARFCRVVRDRSGRTRRLIEIAAVDRPLTGRAKQQALDSYRGIEKYTYVEHFDHAPCTHMLKRYDSRTGQFLRWPEPQMLRGTR